MVREVLVSWMIMAMAMLITAFIMAVGDLGHREGDIGDQPEDIGHRAEDMGHRAEDIGHRAEEEESATRSWRIAPTWRIAPRWRPRFGEGGLPFPKLTKWSTAVVGNDGEAVRRGEGPAEEQEDGPLDEGDGSSITRLRWGRGISSYDLRLLDAYAWRVC